MAKKGKKEVKAPVVEVAEEGTRVKGPRGVDGSAAITLLVTGNPKRAGSKAYDRYNAYVDGMSVDEALAAGITTPDLVYDTKHGFISIEGYDPGVVLEPKPKKEKASKEEKAAKKASRKADEAAALAAAEVGADEETME